MRLLLLLFFLIVPSLAFAGETVNDSFNRFTLLPDGKGGWQYWPSDTRMTSAQAKQFQSALPQFRPLPVLPDRPPLTLDPITSAPIQHPRSPSDDLFKYPR